MNGVFAKLARVWEALRDVGTVLRPAPAVQQ